MKKLLNTLYVMTGGTYLHLDGECIVAEKEQKMTTRIPIHTLSGIICIGNIMCSPHLLGYCAESGVKVTFLTESGRFLARINGAVSGNVLLRVSQVKTSIDKVKSLDIAKSFILGKLLNTRYVLQRRLRDHGEDIQCQRTVDLLGSMVHRIHDVTDFDTLRGIEGECAKWYFATFNKLILTNHETFDIESRNRRPPLDPTNSMLSFLYTLLTHECEGALESVGLDPQIGFFHTLRPGRPSLALDLMEEFRVIIVDRLVLSLINRKQINKSDFLFSASGAVSFNEDARKKIIHFWQNRKKEAVTHPFLNEKMEIGLLFYAQALILARFLRGDIDAYPPYLQK